MYLLSASHRHRVVVVGAGLWPCRHCRCRCAAMALATGVTSLLSSSLAMVLSSSLSVVPPWSMPGGGGGGGGGGGRCHCRRHLPHRRLPHHLPRPVPLVVVGDGGKGTYQKLKSNCKGQSTARR